MIVKILSSASNFEGIDYSERKNDQGKSQLLKAENFGALGHQKGAIKKADYINYMKLICDTNPRVKKKQFHAVISVKGQTYSPEQLGDIAQQYLKSMGYGDNPYLIYSHSDTDNNHVHMVSTRVDRNGRKVNDSYEKIRSQKVLQQILGQDSILEVKTALNNAIGYNFSTMAQFKLLLEQSGIKVSEASNKFNLIKYGTNQYSIDQMEVKRKLSDYQPPSERIKQLQAIFKKYKTGRDIDNFKNALHNKFGIQLITHQQKGKDRPYGYTIIDHPKKEVLKGSEILELRKLLVPAKPDDQMKLYRDYYGKANFKQISFSKFRRDISNFGLVVDDKGFIRYEKGIAPVEKVAPEKLDQMKYLSRLQFANQFIIKTELEKAALARVFRVLEKDLTLTSKPLHDMISYYKNIYSSLYQTQQAEEIMMKNELSVIKYQGIYFLIDSKNKYLLELNQLRNANKPIPIKVINFDREVNHEISIERSISSGMKDLFQLIAQAQIDNSKEHHPKRKRKKTLKL